VTAKRLISVNAQVAIDIGDDRVSVRGDGSSVIVEVPSVSLAFQMMRDLGSIRQIRARVADCSALLARAGLTVVVRTPSRKLLTIGRDGNSRILSLFGVANLKLHLS
jgi:hypothetical protein